MSIAVPDRSNTLKTLDDTITLVGSPALDSNQSYCDTRRLDGVLRSAQERRKSPLRPPRLTI